ncbi:MAG: thioredoxin [Oculatellaceae cyanobacterium bins.114]|nr:thioredoxin [Oculatellaceae cyanobacterium bins.114]
MSSVVLNLSDSEFATEVLSAKQPVLVYFWAPWCGPCRLMAPAIDWAANYYGDRLKVVKMEVDPNPESVARCNVQGVPALVVFKEGEPVETIEGAINKQKLEELLSQQLTVV